MLSLSLTGLLGLITTGIAGLGLILPGGLGAAGVIAVLFGWLKKSTGYAKLAIAGGALLVVLAGVSFHFYQLSVSYKKIADLNASIVVLNAQVMADKVDIDNLKTSNSSLEKSLQQAAEHNADLLKYANTLQTSNDDILSQLSTLHSSIETGTIGKKTDTAFIGVANSNTQCELKNYFNFGGQCVNGEWRK